MPVALGDFLAPAELFVIAVLNAERTADVVDAILPGRGVVAPGGFVADGVGILPLGVDVPRGQSRARLGVLTKLLRKIVVSGARR